MLSLVCNIRALQPIIHISNGLLLIINEMLSVWHFSELCCLILRNTNVYVQVMCSTYFIKAQTVIRFDTKCKCKLKMFAIR